MRCARRRSHKCPPVPFPTFSFYYGHHSGLPYASVAFCNNALLPWLKPARACWSIDHHLAVIGLFGAALLL